MLDLSIADPASVGAVEGLQGVGGGEQCAGHALANVDGIENAITQDCINLLAVLPDQNNAGDQQGDDCQCWSFEASMPEGADWG